MVASRSSPGKSEVEAINEQQFGMILALTDSVVSSVRLTYQTVPLVLSAKAGRELTDEDKNHHWGRKREREREDLLPHPQAASQFAVPSLVHVDMVHSKNVVYEQLLNYIKEIIFLKKIKNPKKIKKRHQVSA